MNTARQLCMEYAAFEITISHETTPKDTLKFAAKEAGKRFIEDDWYLISVTPAPDSYDGEPSYTVMVGR